MDYVSFAVMRIVQQGRCSLHSIDDVRSANVELSWSPLGLQLDEEQARIRDRCEEIQRHSQYGLSHVWIVEDQVQGGKGALDGVVDKVSSFG